jgi:hypothetical protein
MLTAVLFTIIAVASAAGDDERAAAWLRVIQANENSFEGIVTQDTVRFHFPDGSDAVVLQSKVAQDAFRRLTFIGKQSYLSGDSSHRVLETVDLEYTLCDGELRGLNRERGYGIIRPENPANIDCWMLPGPAMGLGFCVNLSDLRRRSDYLAECKDLRIVSENERAVVLEGTGFWANKWLRNQVELDIHTGDVLRHTMFDASWDIAFVEWRMSAWTAAEGVRIPLRTEYRVYSLNLDADLQIEVSDQLQAAALSRKDMNPDSLRYSEWLVLRDRLFPGGVPVSLAAPWQSCESEVISVGDSVAPSDCRFSDEAVSFYYSGAMESRIDCFELAPCEPKRIP